MARKNRQCIVVLGSVFLGAIVWLLALGTALGQDTPTDAPAEEERVPSVFPEADRDIRKKFSDAKKLMELQHYAEAGQKIGELLEMPEDYLVPGETKTLFRCMKLQAEEMLKKMPEEGRKIYELKYGTTAKQLLEEGVAAGDIPKIALVFRRYFYTEAGAEAAFVLGMHYLDHQYPLSAAILFQKIFDQPETRARFSPMLPILLAAAFEASGQEERAKKVLEESHFAESPEWKRIRLGGVSDTGKTDTAEEMLAWLKGQFPTSGEILSGKLQHWLLARGDARRNAVAEADLPVLTPMWKVPVLDHPEAMALVECQRRQVDKGEMMNIPTATPLVTGNTVLMRAIWGLSAIDLHTGKRLWEVPSDGYPEIMRRISELGGNGNQEEEKLQISTMAALLQLRLWSEGIYGSLSSDGKQVFCVEDTLDTVVPKKQVGGVLPQIQVPGNVILVNGRLEEMNSQTRPNRLAAYNIRTGKLLWHIGGQVTQWNLAESGTMFLGAPLPVGGDLYVIAQRQGEVFLLALDATTGKTLWRQTLCLEPQDDIQEANLPALSPSYSDGILLCPTPNKALVAVDVVTQSILWGNVYGQEEMNSRRFRNRRIVNGMLLNDLSQGSYEDGSVLISDGLVLYLPHDSKDLLCLRLADGTEVWRKELSQAGYIGCIRGGKVVVVAQNTYFLYDVHDAEYKRSGSLPDGASISGVGFSSGSALYLPMDSGKVGRLEISDNPTWTLSVSHEGELPGNLIPAGRFILSQQADYLTAYVQQKDADVLVRELYERDANSPEALAIEASRLWDAGKLAEATATLRRGGEYSKKALYMLLMEGLKNDFPHFSAYKEELLGLLDTPEEKVDLFRFVIPGLEKAGQWDEALTQCRDLAEKLSETLVPLLFDETKTWTLSAEEWLAKRLQKIHEVDAMRESLSQFLNEKKSALHDDFVRWKEANPNGIRKSNDPETVSLLARHTMLLTWFAELGDIQPIWEDYLELLKRCRMDSLAELLLLEKAKKGTDKATVYDSVITMFRESSRPENAIPYEAWKSHAAGKTPESWPPAWKSGRIIAEEVKEKSDRQAIFQPQNETFLSGEVPPPFWNQRFGFVFQNSVTLCVDDAWGNSCWRLDLDNELAQGVRNLAFRVQNDSRDGAVLRAVGHVIFGRFGTTLLAVDTSVTPPKVLWSWSPRSRFREGDPLLAPLVRQLENKLLQSNNTEEQNSQILQILSADEQNVCVQLNGKLVSLDARTGQVRWERVHFASMHDVVGTPQRIYLSSLQPMPTTRLVIPNEATPLTVVRDVTLDELLSPNLETDESERAQQLRIFKQRTSIPKNLQEAICQIPMLDPQTGQEMGTKRFPRFADSAVRRRIGDQKVLYSFSDFAIAAQEEIVRVSVPFLRHFALYDLDAERFDWIAFESRAFNETQPTPVWQTMATEVHHRSQVATVTEDFRVEIFDLEKGEVVLRTEPLVPETPLSPEHPRREELVVLRVYPDDRDGYVIAFSSEPKAEAEEDENTPDDPDAEKSDAEKKPLKERITQVHNVHSDEMYRGLVYHVDGQGKSLWKAPIFVAHSFLLTGIPEKLPILGFAHLRHVQRLARNGNTVYQTLWFLDSRNARTLYDVESKKTHYAMLFRGNPKENVAYIDLPNAGIRFTFTEEPYPETDPTPVRPKVEDEIQELRRKQEMTQRNVDANRKRLEQLQEEFKKKTAPTDEEKDQFNTQEQNLKRMLENLERSLQDQEKTIQEYEKLLPKPAEEAPKLVEGVPAKPAKPVQPALKEEPK